MNQQQASGFMLGALLYALCSQGRLVAVHQALRGRDSRTDLNLVLRPLNMHSLQTDTGERGSGVERSEEQRGTPQEERKSGILSIHCLTSVSVGFQGQACLPVLPA